MELANKRRKDAETLLEEYFIDPLQAPSSSDTIKNLQGEIQELRSQLKIEELQKTTLTTVFIDQEAKYKKEIEDLKAELAMARAQTPHSMPGGDTMPIPMSPPHPAAMDMPPLPEGVEEMAETADPITEEDEGQKVKEYLRLEQELKDKILQEIDPIAKENMEWELRILHSANMDFFQYGDAYRYFHTPTLPLPLLKLESEACAKKLRPDVLDDELGGWHEIDLNDWRRPEVMQNQPSWRISWFRKHPDTIVAYAQAPRDLRINPVFCPCIRRRSWPAFQSFNQMRPNYLNYPMMPGPGKDQRPTETYMLRECQAAIQTYKAMPDLACLMLVKICKMVIAGISTFQNTERRHRSTMDSLL